VKTRILLFAACLAVVLGGLGWVSVTALQRDRAEITARAQAEFEEDVRLVLWRMDSALAALLARESARPYIEYDAFYPTTSSDQEPVPSSLLLERPEHVRLHVEIDPTGALSSPQAPEGKQHDLALAHVSADRIADAEKQLAALTLDRPRLIGALGQRDEDNNAVIVAVLEPEPVATTGKPSTKKPARPPAKKMQQEKGDMEWQSRARSVQQATSYGNQLNNSSNIVQQAQLDGIDRKSISFEGDTDVELERVQPQGRVSTPLRTTATRATSTPVVTTDPMQPLWLDGNLLLARRVRVGEEQLLQAAILDWESIRTWLLADVRDLMPEAQLEPVPTAMGPRDRMLASLPVRLLAAPRFSGGTSAAVLLTLAVAWTAVLLAAAAVAILLMGALQLSERRGAFVSAVTHELRTPLTTFRTYTDMLADGMVTDPTKRQQYLETLRREATRLGHLVENVLGYARIERKKVTARAERVAVGELIERLVGRLRERTTQAGMELVVDVRDELGPLAVMVDPAAVDHILFNLVDNACKHGAGATDRRIHIVAEPFDSRRVGLRVVDHGPGVPADARRRLFTPFHRSAQKAAATVPGVGLGLALSRRLARAMRGDLRLEQSNEGASFRLILPRA
jgi:signal transduction histidine kinase